MHRIDTATAVVSLPTPAAVGTPGYFSKGNPGPGTPSDPTSFDQDWCNSVQEEICNVIEAAGLTLTKSVRTQLLTSVKSFGRIRLTGNITLYVATTGSDANNGTAIGTPWLTLQHAANVLQSSYDLNGFVATISVADGTYNAGISFLGPMVGGTIVGGNASVFLLGNASTPANCIINAGSGTCISAAFGTGVQVRGFTLTAPGGGSGVGLSMTNGAFQTWDTLVFGACSLAHINLSAGGAGRVGNYSITGNSPVHYNVIENSVLDFQSAVITITGTPAFATAFANAQLGGVMNAPTFSFVGAGATGARYHVDTNGVIFTNGGGASFFPGNAGGAAATGGQYA